VAGYLIGGIGVYNVKFAITSGNTTADSSETKFVWNFGLGLTSFIPFTGGVRFGGK